MLIYVSCSIASASLPRNVTLSLRPPLCDVRKLNHINFKRSMTKPSLCPMLLCMRGFFGEGVVVGIQNRSQHVASSHFILVRSHPSFIHSVSMLVCAIWQAGGKRKAGEGGGKSGSAMCLSSADYLFRSPVYRQLHQGCSIQLFIFKLNYLLLKS